MTDLLSQDEIDALLHGVDDVEETEDAIESEADDAVGFDFSSQDRIVRGRMPTLELINERFARHLRICLLYTSPSPRDRSLSRMPSSA